MNESDNHSRPGDAAQGGRRPLLGLQIPRQSPAQPGNLLLDPKETDDWFDALPMANIGETARQVYNTLVEFNRLEIPDLLRARAVEKFRPPVEYITVNLQKHFVDVGMPLTRKGWKTAALARELQRELAISYKIVIERMISGDSAQFDRRLLVIALHRALYYLGQSLLQNALVYITWPEGIWREINAIYAYASQNQIHQIPVKHDDSRQAPSTSIEDLFKNLMLFASATPHRLRQAHARLLFAQLDEWSAYTSILSEDDGGTSLGRFNVDLWADSAPMHNSLRTPMPGGRMAILDVRPLLKKLRGDFENAPWDSRAAIGSGKNVLTRPLLRLLILAWSRPPDRRFVRTRLNFDLHVVAGLHAVWGNLSVAQDDRPPFATTEAALFELTENDTAEARARAKIDWTSGSLENVSLAPLDSQLSDDSLLGDSRLAKAIGRDAAALRDFAAAPNKPPKAAPSSAAPGAGAECSRHAVTTINESAGGYCIRWKGERIPRVKIGELIGVESPSDPRKYGLGVIRWMHHLPEDCLDLGLEVISTRCYAGEVRSAEKTGPRARHPGFRCLVINDSDAANGSTASLVTSAMTLQPGDEMLLSVDDREQRVHILRLVEFSSAFARYQFEAVRTESATESGDQGQPGDDFNDLWTTL